MSHADRINPDDVIRRVCQPADLMHIANINSAHERLTRMCVRNPAGLARYSRSAPMTPPAMIAPRMGTTRSKSSKFI